jgi:hypothetical protein
MKAGLWISVRVLSPWQMNCGEILQYCSLSSLQGLP